LVITRIIHLSKNAIQHSWTITLEAFVFFLAVAWPRQSALERGALGKEAKQNGGSRWGAVPFWNAIPASTFFIHSIHFSFPFSTDLHLTPAGLARYFTYRKVRHAASTLAVANFQQNFFEEIHDD
jgi:hypothetical protein